MTHEHASIPIERGGGKLEITRALAAAGFPVPRSEYLYYSDLDKPNLLAACFRSFPNPVVVRGSHPNDWQGYIDVLPTFLNVDTEQDFEYAITKIKATAASDAVRAHAEDWGQPFSPEVHILVQEQHSSSLIGSMLRHPHVLGRIDVNYIDRDTYHPDYGTTHALIRRARSGKIDNKSADLVHIPQLSDAEVEEVFGLYEQVEQSGLLDPEWVYQMELGFRPLSIFQLRPFKRREAAQDFELPDVYGTTFPTIRSRLVFGITPADGILLDFTAGLYRDIEMGDLIPTDQPYGFITGKVRRSLATDIRLNALKAYVTPTPTAQYLEHGDYRLLKRAQFGMVEAIVRGTASPADLFYAENLGVFEHAHLWSNGSEAVLIPEEFAAALS